MKSRSLGIHAILLFIGLADLLGAFLTYQLGQRILYAWGVISWLWDSLAYLWTLLVTHLTQDWTSLVLIILFAVFGIISLAGPKGDKLNLFIGLVIIWGVLLILRLLFIHIVVRVSVASMLHPLMWHEALVQARLLPMVGWAWLGYYLLTHLLLGRAPYRASEDLPLEQAVTKGPYWQHIQACFERYRFALDRFHFTRLRLKTPPTFLYYEGSGAIYWIGRTLVLPEALLTPDLAKEEILVPALARALLEYNAPIPHFSRFVPLWRKTLTLLLTGNCFCIPAIVAALCWSRWEAARELDKDYFAYLLGQGELLIHQYRRARAHKQQQGEPDNSSPRLAARIDQLSALIDEEDRQMERMHMQPHPSLSRKVGDLS
jgi:hypothetical protein